MWGRYLGEVGKFYRTLANLSKTLRISFYQNRSSIVEVMIKKVLVCFLCPTVYYYYMYYYYYYYYYERRRTADNDDDTILQDVSPCCCCFCCCCRRHDVLVRYVGGRCPRETRKLQQHLIVLKHFGDVSEFTDLMLALFFS